MSNNLVSEQLAMPSMQVGQLEPVLNKLDSSMPEMSMGIVGSVGYISGHPVSQQYSLSNNQTTLVSDNPLSHELPSAEMQMGQIEDKGINTLQSQKFLLPNKQTGQMGSMMNNMEQISSLKRKAPAEPISHNHTPENMSMLQKRMAQTQHRPWLQQMSATIRKVVQLESIPSSAGSLNSPASSKRLVKTDSFSNKIGSQRTPSQKNQSARTQPPSKVSKDSSDSVRSKMREQLAAALSLVTERDNKPTQVGNNCSGETKNCGTPGNNQPAGSVLTAADAVDDGTKEVDDSVDSFSFKKIHDQQTEFKKILPEVGPGDSTLVCDGREFQSSNDLSYEDVPFSDNFFVKDELLQGNGLSWVLDSDLDMVDRMEIPVDDKPKLDNEELSGGRVEEAHHQSPEDVAFEIEAELFKLFGGVNKKYKEKGRSLLFNLKDRNNPELRERVMAGEISPERLCSMTAEELASKELSEWRMAKAEELAQMVVLPDTEVDVRRLVKKTHKGEFQVEVEQDDILPVDISGGSSSVTQSQPKGKTAETPTLKPDGKKGRVSASSEKSNVKDRNTSYTLTIPSHEGTDLMQGLMVDDGLKDVDFLPPIVSLDEFMESLDSEPPFANLPLDSERMTPLSDKDDSETGSGLKSSDQTSKDIVNASSEKGDNMDNSRENINADVKSNGSRHDSKSNDNSFDVKSRTSHVVDAKANGSPPKGEICQAPRGTPMGQHVWEGTLQLNISSTATVIGCFKSGEKTSASEWPGFIEIKGRVRLDAFEKFLQQLPLSRSRAIMVVHFVLNEGSSESELAALQEVSESYVLDERVGFAEPASGVELYFCPPHNKTLELLGKVIQKEHIEALNEIDNGLIGVIVWRKLSSTSPKSSSHHKHTSKKQHLTSRRHQDSTLNSNFAPKSSLRQGLPPANSRPSPNDDDDDEDDVPPGFGPPAARDEDDLPEFKFSGGSNPPVSRFSTHRGPGMATFSAPGQTSRPVDQVRELIHKYGQSDTPAFPGGGRASVQPWNDDDDDIPEWQPQAPTQVHNFQQKQMVRPQYVNQPHMGLVSQQQPVQQTMPPMQTPINATNGSENPSLWQQQGTWWVPSAHASDIRPTNISCQPDAGQYYGASGRTTAGQPGAAWQQNVPKSRGF